MPPQAAVEHKYSTNALNGTFMYQLSLETSGCVKKVEYKYSAKLLNGTLMFQFQGSSPVFG